MSIKSAPYYWLECDACGVKSTEDGDISAWSEVDHAFDDAGHRDWTITNDGKHYCWQHRPKDEEDE